MRRASYDTAIAYLAYMPMPRSLRSFPWPILVAAAILAACTQREPPAILSPLCQPPCWQGITPGETSFADALAVIPQIPEVRLRSLAVRDEGSGRQHVRCLVGPPGAFVFVEITAANGTVSTISLSLAGDVSLQDVIIVYGEPALAGGFYGPVAGHWRRAFLLYTQGVEAVLTDAGWPHTDTWRLRPSDTVDYLFFFNPDSLASPPQGDWLFLAALWPNPHAFAAAGRPWAGYSTLSLRLVR